MLVFELLFLILDPDADLDLVPGPDPNAFKGRLQMN